MHNRVIEHALQPVSNLVSINICDNKIYFSVGKDANDPGRLLESLTEAFNTKLQLEEVS